MASNDYSSRYLSKGYRVLKGSFAVAAISRSLLLGFVVIYMATIITCDDKKEKDCFIEQPEKVGFLVGQAVFVFVNL